MRVKRRCVHYRFLHCGKYPLLQKYHTMATHTLTREQIFDLHVLNRDATKSFGVGFFPKEIGNVLEKYAIVGGDSIDTELVMGQWQEFLRKGETVIDPTATRCIEGPEGSDEADHGAVPPAGVAQD
jgi:hypothetical protein